MLRAKLSGLLGRAGGRDEAANAARPDTARPWAAPFPPGATADDIYHCFRLLLGRNPVEEEWARHQVWLGQDLPLVVSSYLKSREFAERGLLKNDYLARLTLAELDGFRIYTADDDTVVSGPVRAGAYEPDVTAVFRRLLKPGMGVVDIGANIGYLTMLAAALVGAGGYVLAVEPNPQNVKLLEASRRSNGFAQVTVAQTAAGRGTGLLVLHGHHSNGVTAALPDDPAEWMGAETVPCTRVDNLVPADRRIDLIKVDVEGAEYEALLGCRDILARWRPTIVCEFSADFMRNFYGIDGPEFLGWFLEQGYGLGVIEPDGTIADHGRDTAAVMAVYHARGADHIDLALRPA